MDLGKDKVIIDAGAGETLGPDLGKLAGNLMNTGIKASDITAVLLTHCHLDHIGGLMRDNQPSFPNATIYLSEKEWNFWSAKNINLSTMSIEQTFRDNFKDVAFNKLHPLKERVKYFRFGEEILPGIQAVEAIGYSPGHANYWIRSGSESLLHTGDLFHHPAFDLKHLNWVSAFGQDAKQAYKTRLRILDMASEERIFLMAYHMPFPAIGHVFGQGGHYGWASTLWIFDIK